MNIPNLDYVQNYLDTIPPIKSPTYNETEWENLKRLYSICEIFLEHWLTSKSENHSKIINIKLKLLIYLDYQFKNENTEFRIHKKYTEMKLKEFKEDMKPINILLPIRLRIPKEEKKSMQLLRSEFEEIINYY